MSDPVEASGDGDAPIDPDAEERGNIRNLLRWVGGFFAWPGLSIAFVFLLDFDDHMGHFFISLAFGVLGVVAFVMAPRWAERFYPVE